MSPRAVQLVCSLAAIAALLVPAAASAHPLVDQARAQYDATRHREALELLDRAEEERDLTRADLEELLLLKAMIHRALRQMDLAEVDMFRLASLDPSRELGREVPPQLRRVFEQVLERVPGPVRVEVRAERAGEVVTIRAEVLDDVAALAQGFRIFGRADGGPLRQSTEARLDVTALPHQDAEYWAEVIGPGGAPIATFGTEAAPERLPGDGAATPVGGDPDPAGTDPGSDPSTGEDEGVPVWPFLVGGAAIVVGVAIVLAVVLTQPSDESQLTRPTVTGLAAAPLTLLAFD